MPIGSTLSGTDIASFLGQAKAQADQIALQRSQQMQDAIQNMQSRLIERDKMNETAKLNAYQQLATEASASGIPLAQLAASEAGANRIRELFKGIRGVDPEAVIKSIAEAPQSAANQTAIGQNMTAEGSIDQNGNPVQATPGTPVSHRGPAPVAPNPVSGPPPVGWPAKNPDSAPPTTIPAKNRDSLPPAPASNVQTGTGLSGDSAAKPSGPNDWWLVGDSSVDGYRQFPNEAAAKAYALKNGTGQVGVLQVTPQDQAAFMQSNPKIIPMATGPEAAAWQKKLQSPEAVGLKNKIDTLSSLKARGLITPDQDAVLVQAQADYKKRFLDQPMTSPQEQMRNRVMEQNNKGSNVRTSFQVQRNVEGAGASPSGVASIEDKLVAAPVSSRRSTSTVPRSIFTSLIDGTPPAPEPNAGGSPVTPAVPLTQHMAPKDKVEAAKTVNQGVAVLRQAAGSIYATPAGKAKYSEAFLQGVVRSAEVQQQGLDLATPEGQKRNLYLEQIKRQAAENPLLAEAKIRADLADKGADVRLKGAQADYYQSEADNYAAKLKVSGAASVVELLKLNDARAKAVFDQFQPDIQTLQHNLQVIADNAKGDWKKAEKDQAAAVTDFYNSDRGKLALAAGIAYSKAIGHPLTSQDIQTGTTKDPKKYVGAAMPGSAAAGEIAGPAAAAASKVNSVVTKALATGKGVAP
jgi:hypothetical protein